MSVQKFPEGAEAAEIWHRESQLGSRSELLLAERISDWEDGGEPAPPKIDHPDAPRLRLPRPGLLASKRLGFLDCALRHRRSTRALSGAPLTKAEAGLLLWAAAGRVQDGARRRTFPSAGGLESTALYLCSAGGAVPPGTWRFEADAHELARASSVVPEELSPSLPVPGGTADWPALALFATRLDPLLSKYGERGYRFALLEIGHAAQNLLLAAAGLGLGAVPVGGYLDAPLRDAVSPASDEAVLYVVGLGRVC